jgi:hypothetical protein
MGACQIAKPVNSGRDSSPTVNCGNIRGGAIARAGCPRTTAPAGPVVANARVVKGVQSVTRAGRQPEGEIDPSGLVRHDGSYAEGVAPPEPRVRRFSLNRTTCTGRSASGPNGAGFDSPGRLALGIVI